MLEASFYDRGAVNSLHDFAKPNDRDDTAPIELQLQR